MARKSKLKPISTDVFKIRNPATGLYLKRKPHRWTKQSWGTDGAIYKASQQAQNVINHYVLNTNHSGPPLEIVRFEIAERSTVSVPLQIDTKLRNFMIAASGVSSTMPKDRLAYSLVGQSITAFTFDTVIGGYTPRWVVWVRGRLEPVTELGMKGVGAKAKFWNRARTYVATDDAGLVALKLAHNDDIVQIWDYDAAELVEGNRYATGD